MSSEQLFVGKITFNEIQYNGKLSKFIICISFNTNDAMINCMYTGGQPLYRSGECQTHLFLPQNQQFNSFLTTYNINFENSAKRIEYQKPRKAKE